MQMEHLQAENDMMRERLEVLEKRKTQIFMKDSHTYTPQDTLMLLMSFRSIIEPRPLFFGNTMKIDCWLKRH